MATNWRRTKPSFIYHFSYLIFHLNNLFAAGRFAAYVYRPLDQPGQRQEDPQRERPELGGHLAWYPITFNLSRRLGWYGLACDEPKWKVRYEK